MWIIELDVAASNVGTANDFKDLLRVAYADLRTNSSLVSSQMWGTLTDGQVTFKAVTTDLNREDAGRCVSAAVRAALTAAGTSTPGWVEQTEALLAALDLARSVAEPVAERVPVPA